MYISKYAWIYIYIYMHTHRYVYIYIYMCGCLTIGGPKNGSGVWFLMLATLFGKPELSNDVKRRPRRGQSHKSPLAGGGMPLKSNQHRGQAVCIAKKQPPVMLADGGTPMKPLPDRLTGLCLFA